MPVTCDAWTDGVVTKYDSRRGFADVALEALASTATLFVGAFFSGLPTRYPRVGDRVRIQVRPKDDGTYHALVARLQA